MQITLERQSKTIALSFNTDNSIAYDELYLAVQDKMSAIVNGGKFFVGKAFTIVGNAVSVLSKNIYVQGLTVAAAGGLGSRLAGGSFELGFLTAGLAFAVNQVVTQLAQERKVIDSTREAIDHYRNGNGETVELGSNIKNALTTSGEQQYRSNRIKTGQTSSLSGNYGVDLTGDVFHVGDTTVQYNTVCSDGSCTTTYTGFTRNLPDGGYGADGFWDVFGGNDTIGPQGEFGGGTPYPYTPYEWTDTYPDPY